MPNLVFAWGWAVRDTARQSSENPTIYLGDSIEFHWDVNADGWGATYKKAGAGTNNSSSGMNWQDLTWVDEAGDGFGGNEGIKSASFQGTSVATWYYSLWLGWGSSVGDNGHWYTGSSSWNEGSGSFVSSSFTVSALGNPTGVSAARDATYPTSRVDLSWTEWNNKNVLIVRRKGSSVAWTPSQGTAYSDGQSLGSDTYVVENSRDGGSFEDTGIGTALEAGTLYYYKVYSENYSYYSSGTEVSVRTRPTDATWDGGGADNNTLTEANWNNDLYPAASANSVMRFAGSTRTTPSVNHAANSDFGSVYFNSGASAFTISGNAVDIFSLIQNDSSNAQTIQNTLALNGAVSLNTVSGNLNLNGVLSGSYGIKKTGTATAAITNANTFTGGAWVEKGTLQLGGHTNAMGSGAVSVGTNAALDLAYGAVTLRPVALTLYNGQVTKASAGATTWRGALNSYNSSTVTVSSGNFYVYGGMDLASGTLVFNNANQGGMSGGTMTGSGHLTKQGAGVFQLRPGTHSGNIALSEGEIRQYTGAMTASGTLTLSGGTRYSADGSTTRTLTKNVVINGGVGIAEYSTGGITISGSVGLGSGTRTITNSNTLTISGVISAGGLEKKGAGTMILSGNNTYASGTTVTEGTLQIGDNGTSGSIIGNIVNNAALVFNRSDNLTYGGVISGTGTLDKEGAGALTLTNTSTYSGNTTVTAGTLIQNGTNSSSAVTVSSGTSLVGGGAVGGLTVTGSVYPGTSAASIGRLTVTSLTMNNGSAAYFQIGDCDNTSDRDYISNSGSATINATTTIYIDDDAVSNWDAASSYTWSLITGGIADASNFTLDESLWALNKVGGMFSLSASGGNLVLTFTPSTVEPSTQATVVTFSNIADTSMTVSWTPGDGANRIVVAREAGAVDSDPTDSSTYTASATFGSGTEIGTGNFVVYKGSGSSVPVTGLDPATVYHFRVYEFNGSGGMENYMTDAAAGNPASQTTYAAQPSTQTTALNVTASGETTMSLGWTRGNGNNVLVVARSGTAAEEPSDGSTYTADAAWGLAGTVGTVSKAVYRDTGTTVALTGLTAETLYHFSAFELSGSGGTENYLLTSAPVTNRYTLSTEPSAHPGSFTAAMASEASINLSWGAATGESGFIIIRRQGAAPTGSPVDGVVYAQGSAIGDGTVVYVTTTAGAGSTTDSYGSMSASTAYYYLIFPYKYDGTESHATHNYRTQATVLGDNATTGAAEPSTNPSAPTFSEVSGISMKITWTGGNGAGTIVLMKEASSVNSTPSDWGSYSASTVFGSGSQIGTGNYVVYVSADSGAGNVTVTGLKQGVTYYVALHCYNGTGSDLNYKTASPATGSQVTLAEGTSMSATADGSELVDLAWTKHASYNVMIVMRATNTPTGPTQGTSYSVGDSIGADGTRVLYKGSGSSLEHVVPPGSTNYYRFYSYSGANYYSTGTPAAVQMSSYNSGEVVDPFPYTNSVSLNNLSNQVSGWSGKWVTSGSGSWSIQSGNLEVSDNYPPEKANRVSLTSLNNGEDGYAERDFTTYNSGTLFASVIVKYDYNGDNKWAGFDVMDGSTAKIRIGKMAANSSSYGFGMYVYGGSLIIPDAWNQDETALLVFKFDFANDEASCIRYYSGDTVPTTEPSWSAGNKISGLSGISSLNRIRLTAGSDDGGATVGGCEFDEVRVSASWEGLFSIDVTPPLLPASAPINGEFFRVFVGTDSVPAYTNSGTTNVWYRISDNRFDTTGSAGLSGNLQNPGFTGNAIDWTQTTGNNIANYSSTAGDLCGGSGGGLQFNAWDNTAGAFGEYYQDVAVTAGANVVFSGLMRQDSNFATTFFGLKLNFLDTDSADLGGSAQSSATVDTSTQTVSVAATAPGGSATVRCTVRMTDPPGPTGGGGVPSDLVNKGFDGSASSWTKQDDIAFYDGNAGANAGGSGGGLKFDAWNDNKSGSYYQDAVCEAGNVVTFSARMRQDGTWTTTFFGTRIQFLDSDNNVLATHSASGVTDPVTTISKVIPVSGTAPANTVKVRCIIRMEGSPNISNAHGYADDATLTGATTTEGGSSRFGYVDGMSLSGAGSAISGSATLSLVFSGYDGESGLSRGTADANSQCNIDVTNSRSSWKIDDVSNYSSSRSSSSSTAPATTSTWYWASLTASDFASLLTDNYCNTNMGSAYANDGREYGTNRVTASIFNNAATQKLLTNQLYGYISIQDDDISAPTPTLLYVGTNILNDTYSEASRKITVTDEEMLGGGVDFAYSWADPSGIFLTNTTKVSGAVLTNQFEVYEGGKANVCPNFDLTNATFGSLGKDVIHSPDDMFGKNGDQIVTVRVVNLTIPGIAKTNMPLHQEWTLTASAQDVDNDRGSFASVNAAVSDAAVSQDRMVAINTPMRFSISDDDITGPVFSGLANQFGEDEVSDAQLRAGGWWMTVDAQDEKSGIGRGDGAATSPTNISPYISIYSPSNYPLVLNNVFSNYNTIVDGISGRSAAFVLSNLVVAADYDHVVLGTYTITVSAADADNDRYGTDGQNIDLAMTLASNVGTFVVYDDDTNLPSLSFTTLKGQSAQGYYTDSGEMMYYDFGTEESADLQPARIFSTLAVADLTVQGTTPATAAGESGNAVSYGYWNTATSFWEFVVTVQDGFRLTMQTIKFGSRATSTGPTDWALKYSGDGYADALASGSLNNNGSFETISASLTSVTNTGAVTFRLYGSGASSYAGTWRLDNLSFTGKMSTVSGTYLATDSDLFTNGLVVQAGAQDSYSGIYSITNEAYNPVFVFTSPLAVISNSSFAAGPTVDGSPTNTLFALSVTNGFAYADIVLGTYTATVTVTDCDDDRPGDRLVSVVTGVVAVVDDDTGAPKYSTARGTYLTFDGISAGSEGSAVTDGMLTNGLSITNRLYDEKSGILSTSVQFRLMDPNGWDSGLQDFTTGPADGGSHTNKFADDTVVSVDGFDVELQNRALGVWTTLFYATDYDLDRPGDALSTTQSFVMYVADDDKLGPRMTNFQSMGSAGTLLATGFEVIDGWEAHSEGDWTEEAFDGTWSASNMYVNTLNGRGPENTTAGYNAGVNDVNDSLQMPPVNGPGWVVLWAKLSAEGESKMVLEWLDDSTWTSAGELSITSTGYSEYAWTVGMTNAGVSLRLRMTEKTTGDRSIYFDDLVVAPVRPWTNSAVALAWETASDADTGDSGIDEYRVVGLNAGAPLYTTNGTGLSAVSTSVAPTVEGIVTGYVFAVDADLDRGPIDRTMGLAVPYILKIDTTPPAQIVVTNAAEGPDDTSEIRIGWNPAADAGNPALSPWKSYVVFYTDDGGTADTNDLFVYVDSGGPATLGDISTREVILSNFVNGSTYNLAVAGLDEAGNLGPLGGFTNVTLAVLSVTQSLSEVDTVVTNGVHVSFTATNSQGIMNRKIDVLYADSLQFVEALTNDWQLLGLADSTSFLIDTGQVSGIPPRQLGANMMRFYRAASQNNWLPARNPRSASVEIFGVKPVTLYPGQNWISLPFWPTRRDILHVLGRSLPAGTTGGDEASTKVTWYDRNNGGWIATQEVALLQSSPTSFWLYTEGGGGGDGNDAVLPLHEAFVIELPTNASPQNILLTGRVPTNAMVQTVRAMHLIGTNNVPGRNLVSFNAPRYLHPSQMGLLEAGFKGGIAPIWSDQIWKYDRSGQFAPYPVWYRTSDNTWRHTSPIPFPPVASNYFGPDDGIFIHTRASTSDWSWTNKVLYKLPTSRMDL